MILATLSHDCDIKHTCCTSLFALLRLSPMASLTYRIEDLEQKVSSLSEDVKELKEKGKETTEEIETLKGDQIK